MANSSVRLERAHSEALGTQSAEFFRRLSAYCDVLETDPTVFPAVTEIEVAGLALLREFCALDDILVEELDAVKCDLISRDPAADDSAAIRPKYLSLEWGTEISAWKLTLANFDRVRGGDGDIDRRGLNGGRSQMLCTILRARLWDLRDAEDSRPRRRSDLGDLWDKVVAIDDRQEAAHGVLERQLEQVGFLPLLSLRVLMTYVREGAEADANTDPLRSWIAVGLEELDSPFRLREAVRPEQARGPLGAAETKALNAFEPGARENLEKVHRALIPRLADKDVLAPWRRMSISDKLLVVGTGIAVLSLVAAVVVPILT